MKWLGLKASPAQCATIMLLYNKMDKALVRAGIIKESVFEIVEDEKLQDIKRWLEKGSPEVQESLQTRYISAIQYYSVWLSKKNIRQKLKDMVDVSRRNERAGRIDGEKEINKGPASGKDIRQQAEIKEDNPHMEIQDDSLEKESDGEIEKRKKFFKDWLTERGFSSIVSLIHINNISRMGKMALDQKITEKNIFLLDQASAVRMIGGRVLRCKDYLEMDVRLQRQYEDSLDYFLKFKKKDREREEEDNKEENKEEQAVPEDSEKKRLEALLREKYENGFRIYSSIDKARLKLFYSEKYGEELRTEDDQIVGELGAVGMIRDDRIYARQDDVKNSLIEKIYKTVWEIFESGSSCVYTEMVYQRYQMELMDTMKIYDANVLGEILTDMSEGKLRKTQALICRSGKRTNVDEDILRVLKESMVPLTYAEIQDKIWYIPIKKIKNVLVLTSMVVNVAPETYFYAPNFPISEKDVIEITQAVKRELENKPYVTDSELREIVSVHCPMVSLDTEDFTTYGFRNCLGYFLQSSFSFQGQLISETGKELRVSEVFAEYCHSREQVNVEELKKLASDINSTIYWDDVRNETIRVSQELFLRCDQIQFDIDAVDHVLEGFLNCEYLPLKDIGLFMQFPPLSVKWNGYVLESFLYKYSKKFRLLHVGFSASGFFGAVVRMESGFCDYRELITDALAHSEEWSDKNSALQFLVDSGFQKKKSYSDIEKVIHEAKLLREKLRAEKD